MAQVQAKYYGYIGKLELLSPAASCSEVENNHLIPLNCLGVCRICLSPGVVRLEPDSSEIEL